MPIKIDAIHIENMRRFQQDMSLSIGRSVTLIAGENATSKSTLLGMLCQPFHFGNLKTDEAVHSVYTDNYNGMKLNDFKTISGTLFKSEYREVFRMSREFDNPTDDNPYSWRIQLSGAVIQHEKILRDGLYSRSRHRAVGQPIRFVTGPGESHGKGEGNFPHPVIYLGLNRLAPLALCSNVQLDAQRADLTKAEQSWIKSQYKKILVITGENLETQYVHSDNKTKGDFLGPKGDYYDAESCSAGQDNLGQILTAVLSFRRLQENLGYEKYQGGVLLIDEIDATLHPLAQENLLKLLITECSILNIQVIATTHSQYLLKLAMEELKHKVSVLFLEASNSVITQATVTDYRQIEDKLQQRLRVSSKKKLTVLLEDEAARDFLYYLIGSRMINCCLVGSCATIISMSAASIPELENVIYLIDGDQERPKKKHPRLLVLPGNDYPEKVVFDFLYNLDESDAFFEKRPQRAIFREHGDGEPDKDQYKSWYRKHKTKEAFGLNAKLAYSRWGEDHIGDIEAFLTDFKRVTAKSGINMPPEVISAVFKRHNIPLAP